MDSALHYRIYEKGINKQVITEYTEFIKSLNFYHATVDHIWRDLSKARN